MGLLMLLTQARLAALVKLMQRTWHLSDSLSASFKSLQSTHECTTEFECAARQTDERRLPC